MKQKFKKQFISRSMICLLGILFVTLSSFKAFSQQKQVKGTITSIDGVPIPGVNVLQKGTGNGAVSDFDGNYALTLTQGSDVLVFSYIGYETIELSVGGKTTLNVSLQESAEGLDEVVIVGYGTTKKVNLTGAVGVASGEVLDKRPIATVGQGLQGVLPGLNVTVQNGDPAQNVDFNIRGFESINGGSPLILVDNVPMDLNQINPNDIESISVLKDASAAAIYGARAAFGVILVTTKKGKKGKVNVTLSTEQTVTVPIFLIEPITDPFVYMTSQNNLAALNGGAAPYNDNRLAGALAYSQNPTLENAWDRDGNFLYFNGFNDYQDKVITDQSLQKKYDLSVSGASEEASYYASFGYLGKEGYLVSDRGNQNFERFNALLKAEFKVNDWLSLDSKIIYTNTTSEDPRTYGDASINSVNRMLPIEPLFFPDLDYYRTPGDRADYEPFIGEAFYNQNVIPYLEEGGRDTYTRHDTWFTQGLTITPFDGFVLKSDFSYNTFYQSYQEVKSKIDVIGGSGFSDGIDLTNVFLDNGFSADDYILNRNQYNQYFTFNIFGEYTYDKLENHNFKAMVGFNQEELRNRTLTARADNLLTPGITDISATTGTQTTNGGRSHYALRGAFFRFNYDYKGKYLLEVSGRYDGTSRFPQEDRFGFFPSFSTGWRISEENFMQGASSWLSNLKFRASYGELGNQIYTQNGQQNFYPYVPSLGTGTVEYTHGGAALPIVSAAALVSPTLTWESVNTTNFGLDASFFKGKLDLTADIFVRETKDMLLRVNLPDILGAAEPLENGADLETKGWELSLNWRDNIGENWKYGIGVNLWDNQTKITKYEGENPSINGFYVGKDIGEIWGFESVGLFESDAAAAAAPSQNAVNGGAWEAGDMQYADLNGDGIIDRGTQSINSETGEFEVGDLKVIGNTTARYSFGLTPRVEYKGLSVNMFFQGILKRDYYPDIGPHAGFWPYNGSLVTQDFLDNSWSATNPDAYFARPRGTNVRNIQRQTRFLQNAAYIRLKNVTINYNLPQDLVSKFGMSNASVYLAGQNLWEYSNMRGTLDPEQTPSGNLLQQYTFERSFSLGLRVTF
jgi:TonB-linked SusC/RagA family outer membrane protein